MVLTLLMQMGSKMEKKITLLLETIDEIVNRDQRPYKEKLQAILDECDTTDKINLSEFIAWFEGVEL